jgi:hypothetical protein
MFSLLSEPHLLTQQVSAYYIPLPLRAIGQNGCGSVNSDHVTRGIWYRSDSVAVWILFGLVERPAGQKMTWNLAPDFTVV